VNLINTLRGGRAKDLSAPGYLWEVDGSNFYWTDAVCSSYSNFHSMHFSVRILFSEALLETRAETLVGRRKTVKLKSFD
jgi:hypothetical protein